MSLFKPVKKSKKNSIFYGIKTAVFFRSFKKREIDVRVKCEKIKRSDLSSQILSEWIVACEKLDASFSQFETAQLENKIRCYKTKALKTVVGEGRYELGESEINSAVALNYSWPPRLQLQNQEINLKEI